MMPKGEIQHCVIQDAMTRLARPSLSCEIFAACQYHPNFSDVFDCKDPFEKMRNDIQRYAPGSSQYPNYGGKHGIILYKIYEKVTLRKWLWGLPIWGDSSIDPFQVVDRTLEQELSRLASGIKQRVAASGTLKSGVHPYREMHNPNIRSLLEHQWNKQDGKCHLCGKPIPITTPNPLLRMSPDRDNSSNKRYDDPNNVFIVHRFCNLAKHNATHEQFDEALIFITL